ncbi:putative CmcJ-like methyltransferase [Coniochaeta ligniaria NRRL 30616]|uniref:Putative CmcJ-like methyltransferase n=1 Tax=Coniochaeta ligniaria NRRL 30616 TaxID=1408157 RepID=A0A1J7J6P4_9PEZI|nr:putative CmcJ-like methyltransferase [Coniochaeta ligniaria NRRL 30616]
METSNQDSRVAQIVHIARDALYETEKPFAADFSAPGKSSNHIFDARDVVVKDARTRRARLTLDKNGFCLLESPTSLTFESLSLDGPDSACLAYYRQMEALVLERFPEYSKVVVLEHQLRKRHSGYPEAVNSKHCQPARLVHRDFTTRGLFLRMDVSFPEQEKKYRNEDMDFLNIWRVLTGPNNDWPLGLCDYASIDAEKDTIPNDMLSRTTVGENELLFASPHHEWYYVSSQNVEEAILFRNASTDPSRSYAFHSALDLKVTDGIPRESIELRMVAFRRAQDSPRGVSKAQ